MGRSLLSERRGGGLQWSCQVRVVGLFIDEVGELGSEAVQWMERGIDWEILWCRQPWNLTRAGVALDFSSLPMPTVSKH